MQTSLIYLILTGFMLMLPVNLFADSYSETVDFDPNQGYISNYGWSHNLSELPQNCNITSGEIRVEAQIWWWGYTARQDILASDTLSFNYPADILCTLTPSTHPSSSSFYTITCPLSSEHFSWITNDNKINFMMVVVNSGTYYLDHSTLEVECESQISQVASATFNPIPGSYDSAQTVEISTTTPGAMIYYTTNGNDPTESSAEYMQPIDIDDTTTLKARAYKDGWGDSEIAVGEYTISLSEINIVPWITPLLFP